MKKGFVTTDGYAAVPFGKKFMILFNGEQLDVVNTENQARKYVNQHQNIKGVLDL